MNQIEAEFPKKPASTNATTASESDNEVVSTAQGLLTADEESHPAMAASTITNERSQVAEQSCQQQQESQQQSQQVAEDDTVETLSASFGSEHPTVSGRSASEDFRTSVSSYWMNEFRRDSIDQDLIDEEDLETIANDASLVQEEEKEEEKAEETEQAPATQTRASSVSTKSKDIEEAREDSDRAATVSSHSRPAGHEVSEKAAHNVAAPQESHSMSLEKSVASEPSTHGDVETGSMAEASDAAVAEETLPMPRLETNLISGTTASSSQDTIQESEESERSEGRNDSRRRTRRGAYALGSGTQGRITERRATLDEDTRVSLGRSLGAIMDVDPSSELRLPRLTNQASVALAKAKMVNSAETVFLAEDVQHDNSRRLVFFATLLVVCVVAILTTVLLVVRSDDDDVCPEDDICCKPIEEMSVFETCSCFNSTFDAYDQLSEPSRGFYDYSINAILASNMGPLFTSNDNFGSDSCEPINQIILHYGMRESFGFTLEAIQQVPIQALLVPASMLMVYVGLDGPHWTNNDVWAESPAICEWYGVECQFQGVIHEMRLANNDLHGAFPALLSMIPEVRNVDLSHNQISGTIPESLSSMSQLTSLQISDLQLEGEIPSGLGNLSRLGILDMHDNKLTGTIPMDLVEMPALRELDVSTNQLTGFMPNATYVSPQLAVLRVNNNFLTGTLPEDMENLSNLEFLNVGRNELSGSIPDFLGRMERLQFINLFKSGLTGTVPESFCNRPPGTGLARMTVDCPDVTFCSCCSRMGGPGVRVVMQCGQNVEFAPDDLV